MRATSRQEGVRLGATRRGIGLLSALSLLIITGCIPTQAQRASKGELKSAQPTVSASKFTVRSARYSLTLPQRSGEVEVEVALSLQWPQGAIGEASLALTLPPGISELPELNGGCRVTLQGSPAEGERAEGLLTCDKKTGAEEIVVSSRYSVELAQLSSYFELDEGERSYGLLVLPPQAWSQLFLGADPNRKITRYLSVISRAQSSKDEAEAPLSEEELLKRDGRRARLGRDLGERAILEESATQGISWSWSREGPLTEPLMVTLGDWEPPQRTTTTSGWEAELFAPVGSAHHEVNGSSFASLQLKHIKHAMTELSAFTNERGSPLLSPSSLWCLTLPHALSDLELELSRWGLITIPEAWYYRHSVRPQAQPPSERAALFRMLIQSALRSELGPWRRGLVSWIARRLTEPSEEVARSLAQQESLQRTIMLDPSLESSAAETPARVELLLDMVDGWLRARPVQVSEAGRALSGSLSLIELIKVLLIDERAISEHLITLAPPFKRGLLKLFSSQEAPLINVEWGWTEGKLTVRVSSEREVIPPMCFKLGVENQEPSRLCIKPARVVGGAPSEHVVTHASRVTWLHPNLEQRGFYRWSLDEPSLQALLDASGLHESEWGTLPEVTSQLMALGKTPPHMFLNSVNSLALSRLTPASLSLLLNYLSRAVHELGTSSKRDKIRRWASQILQGVMYSEELFQRPPISHLINLQLAEWEALDRGFVKTALTKRERAQIDQLLTSSSSADMIAGSTNRVGIEQLQYPLLIKARAGDEALWQQIAHVFAVSEDEPVSRLVTLQALAAFPPPQLESTLKLLIPKEEAALDDELSVTAGSDQGSQTSIQEASAEGAEPKRDDKEDDKEEDDEEEEELVEPSLKPEEALTLIRAVRSLDNRRFAWRWLSERLAQSDAPQLLSMQEEPVQRALLQWGAASCDPAGLKLLDEIVKGSKGFSKAIMRSARVAQSQVRRCLKLQEQREDVERWLEQRLSKR